MGTLEELGIHLVVELVGCPFEHINDVKLVEKTLVAAARRAKATILNTSFHQFSPQGVSGVVVLAESHMSIHTWPELGYAAVDVFTCGNRAMPQRAVDHLVARFKPTHVSQQTIRRGIPATESAGCPAQSAVPVYA